MAVKTVTAIPHINDDPAYTTTRAKMVELQLIRDGLDRKIMELSSSRGNPGRERLDAAAQAMIDGDGGDVTAIDEGALETKRAALYRERSIVHRALELQQPARDESYQKAAYAIRASLIERHKVIGRRIAAAMTELRAALLSENDFRAELCAAGVGPGEPLHNLALPLLGQPDDVDGPYWMLSRWLKETSEYLGE